MTIPENLKNILPDTAGQSAKGHLTVGGCDAVDLVREFGTPLYVFDEATLRNGCRTFQQAFGERYSNTLVIYACKAFINRALAQVFKEEGLGLDVVSGGELYIAKSAGFPMDRVYFHGNNKTPHEIELALDCGIGQFVVDNFHELSLLNDAAQRAGITQDILLRLSPGVDPHTHKFTTTGIIDSKFGFPIVTGQAEEAIAQAIAASSVNLVGLHVHLGSPIFEIEPYKEAIKTVVKFAAEMRDKHGLELREFSPGGGFATPYTREDRSPGIAEYAEDICATLRDSVREYGVPEPRLVIEPGRSIVGRAGVAIYSTGAIKEIPGVRKYISLDGGMADNIRPALYGARYDALVANNKGIDTTERVTLAGKFCESGDILIKDIDLPKIDPGDIVAVPVSGGYCLSMASNYNASLRPAVIMVNNGKAKLVQRRETFEDIVRRDEL